jgi:OOP family OmpA-OmpF porin
MRTLQSDRFYALMAADFPALRQEGEPMKNTQRMLVSALAIVACATMSTVNAQTKDGHWTQGVGGPVWKNGSGQCWKQTSWTPAMAIEECDPDLVHRAAPPPPPLAPRPAAKPAAKPAPKAVVLTSTVHFPLGGTKLDKAAMAQLDKDIIAKLPSAGQVAFANVNGYTDRLGSAQFNQKLSERRAAAVKAYLVSKGMDGSKIEVIGFGKTGMGSSQPFASCNQKNRKQLIACLAPNRRVEVEVHGKPR